MQGKVLYLLKQIKANMGNKAFISTSNKGGVE